MPLPRRFDDTLMLPPDAQAPVDAALLATIRVWCDEGGPLRVARIAPLPGLDGAACALDGSHELARLGRWRGLAWRLQILCNERVGLSGVPWDCGWWRDGAFGAVEAFQPRRRTLLLVREPSVETATALLSRLRATYVRPVRVLMVTGAELASAADITLLTSQS